MSRGGRLRRVEPTTTSANGIWTLNEIADYISETKWPRGPEAPTSLSAAAGNAQLVMSWTAPATTYGTLTNYLIEYTLNGGSSQYVLTNSASTSYTLTGLTNGTAYTVRVAAVNFTAGDYSNAVTMTPEATQAVTLTSGGGGNSWRWQADGFSTDGTWAGGQFIVGRVDGSILANGGWRTTWTPSSKPLSIVSAIYTIGTSSRTGGSFSVLAKGANLDNAGQGLFGTSQTAASATASAPSSGDLVIDVTAIVSEIVGRAGWNPGNSIVLYLLGNNAGNDNDWRHNSDTGGSLAITFSL